jgi:deoxyribodipyrimidine photo-lyase
MHGVIRRLKSRQHWDKRWEEVMRAEPKIIDVSHLNLVQLEYFLWCDQGESSENIVNRKKIFSREEHLAWRYLDSFVKERYVNYSKHISKPALSRKGCSRLSPYLTYGNISMRWFINTRISITRILKQTCDSQFCISNWHCHFIQNLKMNVEWSLKM